MLAKSKKMLDNRHRISFLFFETTIKGKNHDESC